MNGRQVSINEDGRVLLTTPYNPCGTATWTYFPVSADSLARIILTLDAGTYDRIEAINKANKPVATGEISVKSGKVDPNPERWTRPCNEEFEAWCDGWAIPYYRIVGGQYSDPAHCDMFSAFEAGHKSASKPVSIAHITTKVSEVCIDDSQEFIRAVLEAAGVPCVE